MKRLAVLLLLLLVPFTFGADYDLDNAINWGPPGESRKSALAKLETRDNDLLALVNALKDASAGTTAPTAPNAGEFWFDTGNAALKQYYASTWSTIWSYADTTSVNMIINALTVTSVDGSTIDANAGTIDNLEATTISAPYATITDVDVVSAEIGSATLGTLQAAIATVTNLQASGGSATLDTLHTVNWSQDNAEHNTVKVNNWIKTARAEVVQAYVSANYALTYTQVVKMDGEDPAYGDTSDSPNYDTGTYTWTCPAHGIVIADARVTILDSKGLKPYITLYYDDPRGQGYFPGQASYGYTVHDALDDYFYLHARSSFVCEPTGTLKLYVASGSATAITIRGIDHYGYTNDSGMSITYFPISQGTSYWP